MGDQDLQLEKVLARDLNTHVQKSEFLLDTTPHQEFESSPFSLCLTPSFP